MAGRIIIRPCEGGGHAGAHLCVRPDAATRAEQHTQRQRAKRCKGRKGAKGGDGIGGKRRRRRQRAHTQVRPCAECHPRRGDPCSRPANDGTNSRIRMRRFHPRMFVQI